MCLKPKDLQTYQSINAKMAKYDAISEEDKAFLFKHNLQQKYDVYMMSLKIKRQVDEIINNTKH